MSSGVAQSSPHISSTRSICSWASMIFAPQLELALLDSRHVQQIVDQPASRSMLRRIISSTDRMEEGVDGSSSIAVTVARTGVSGVRSSWLSVARKRSLARLAASASAQAFCSRASTSVPSAARRDRVMSRRQEPSRRSPRSVRGERPSRYKPGLASRQDRAVDLETLLVRSPEPLQATGKVGPIVEDAAASTPRISVQAGRSGAGPPGSRRRPESGSPARRPDRPSA